MMRPSVVTMVFTPQSAHARVAVARRKTIVMNRIMMGLLFGCGVSSR
jgi:hypothetical protein